VVTYSRLLEVFWDSHDPCRRAWSRQYAAAVFHHDEDQRRLALATAMQQELERGDTIRTEVLPATRFYRAEDYHQKYRLRRNRRIAGELQAHYPEPDDFTDSTATARLNGYLAGHGSAEEIRADLDRLGLSPGARAELEELARRADD
jgi:peptide-methionine (S)-S-oxide reductase